ncbi:MAG: hypothetical protein KDA84_10090, partial [Planctomycetaceae bacterium]|nr:hypothetical protein [Planctomycetaceae bacterium]
MRSPFGIFRKHGTILIAGLVVLCMFAFTLADYLKPQHLPALLGMFAVGTIFYLLGQPSGNGNWLAVVGGVLGLVAVSYIPTFWGPPAAATTSVGKLSEEELQELIENRETANKFMVAVYEEGAGPRPTFQSLLSEIQTRFPDLASQPQFFQMVAPSLFRQLGEVQAEWDRGYQNFSFFSSEELSSSNRSAELVREAVVRDWVMAQEADKLGIRVSNDTITDFVKKASLNRDTKKSIDREKFIKFREETSLSESDLYD